MKIFKNYKSTIILISSIILGGIIGLTLGEKAKILSPFGDIFLNMLLIIIVPLIFLTITESIYKINKPKRISKILITTFLIFIFTSLISIILGIVSTYSVKLIDNNNSKEIYQELNSNEISNSTNDINIPDKIVKMLTVDDFSKLLSRDNMIALIIISILVGLSMSMTKEKSKPMYDLIVSAKTILMNFIKIIMYYAPIGLGCYFAVLVGNFGTNLALGYIKTFIIYLIASLICYFVVYSIYAYISAGKKGIKTFFKYIIPSTLTAICTCSSAASMPINIECSKKMGISDDIADTAISLGTSFHKDGSVLGSVFKIMFLVYLFNDIQNISIFKITLISLISTLLVTAVPIGGGTISETLIITMLGYPISTLPILTIIATIIDIPATVLNVVGDSSSAMLISRIIDGKNWINKKITN